MALKKSVLDIGKFSFDSLRDGGAGHQVNITHEPTAHDVELRTSVGSDTMIIKRTAKFDVEHEEMGKAV